MLCTECGGTGKVQVDTWIGGRQGPPEDHPCSCAPDPRRDTADKRTQNLEKFWPGLGSVEPVATSNLAGRTRENLVLTATVEDLRAHVARLAIDDERLRRTSDVVTDAELLTLQFDGGEPAVDIATTAPDLLILQLGVRQSKNDLLAGIILTALGARRGAARPTWLVIDPDVKIRKGVPCWSEPLAATIARWPQVRPALADDAPAKKADRDAVALVAAVRAAGGRLLRADALKLLDLSDRSLSRVTTAAGLQTKQDPPGSNVVYITN